MSAGGLVDASGGVSSDAEQVRILGPSPKKWSLVLLGSALFVAGGCCEILDGCSGWGWLSVVFFGLGVIVSAVMLSPGGAYLKITPHGFTQVFFFLGCTTYGWKDVERFHVRGIRLFRTVCFNFSADFLGPLTSHKVLAWLAGHGGLLSDNYGMPCGELAALLNRCKEAARAA